MATFVRPDTALIGGNASEDVKRHIMDCMRFFKRPGVGFGNEVWDKIALTEVSIRSKEYEPAKQEAVVVCEIEVFDEMLNGLNNAHGGCLAFLLDVCSTMPLCALSLATGGSGGGGVSQAMNMIFHSPAPSGEHLRIVSTTLTLGSRVMSARCEIWSITQNRLVLSGTHVKMEPSAPRSKL